MRRVHVCVIFSLVVLTVCPPASANRVIGAVTQVRDKEIVAEFPVPVFARSMMMVMSGDGEGIAGTAIVQRCDGEVPPYSVTGELLFASDSLEVRAGKKVYVSSANTGVAPSSIRHSHITSGGRILAPGDLKFYYYAAGQTIGYGALGFGYERRLRLTRGVAIEVDGGVTGVGNVDARNPDVVNADQMLKSASGRLRLDFGPGVGVYAGYRWSEGRGDDDKWQTLCNRLRNSSFVASSELGEGVVRSQGIEYGFALRPSPRVEFLGGFIPAYRTDFGSLGVLDRPAYAAELRLGLGSHPVRLRGTLTRDYWTADLGVSIW